MKFSLIEVRNCFIMPLRTIRQQGLPETLLMNRCHSRRSGIDVGDLEQARRLRSVRAGGGWRVAEFARRHPKNESSRRIL